MMALLAFRHTLVVIVACLIIFAKLEDAESILPGDWSLGNVDSDVGSFGNEDIALRSTLEQRGKPTVAPNVSMAGFRLLNVVEPLNYDLEISTLINVGRLDFYGNVSIEARILENVKIITLHARRLSISNVTIQRSTNKNVLLMNSKIDWDHNLINLTPDNRTETFQKGEIVIINITYSGNMRKDMLGFYVSTYRDRDNNVRYLAVTHFESMHARSAFPCFDEPAMRATFLITIKHDPSYFALSNMPVDTNKSSDGITVFQRTPKMPTYLVAFVVSDFKETGNELDSINFRVFTRPGTEYYQQFALITAMRSLQSLSMDIGIKYSMPKMDLIGLPDFKAGGEENWGFCTFKEQYLISKTNDMTIKEKFSNAYIIAHELAHQWFGNYVTIKWWNVLWLKEGFATLYATETVKKIYPEWDYAHVVHTFAQQFLNSDGGRRSHPLTKNVEQPSEVDSMYSFVSYEKAAAILHMWQHALTEEVFRQGVRNFLESNKFGAATDSDFFDAITRTVQERSKSNLGNITEMLTTWTNQSGQPMLTVKRNYDDGSLIIYQKRFYLTIDSRMISKEIWHIPINYATKSNPSFNSTKFMFIMNKTEHVLELGMPRDDWIVFNMQGTGLYRINYDERNWNLLTGALQENPNQIHYANRGQLLDDAYRFAITGRLKYSIVMELLKYLRKETKTFPWHSARVILLEMDKNLKYHPKYNSFKTFVANLVSGIYKKIGINEYPNELVQQKVLRDHIVNLACQSDMQQCLHDTKYKLIDYTRKGIEIEPDLRESVYCFGLRDASDNEYKFFLNELMAANSSVESERLIKALACSQRKNHLWKLVMSTIDMKNTLELNHRTIILETVYKTSPVGWNVCIAFLKKHWREFNNLIASTKDYSLIDNVIYGMSALVYNKYQKQKFMELYNITLEINCSDGDLQEDMSSKVTKNREWLNKHGDAFMDWFS